MLVLEVLISHHRTVQLQFFSISGWSIDLDYCDIQWFALEMNQDHSSFNQDQVVSETAPKYSTLDSFVDTEGYSISSNGFLPTVVDVMVI